MSVFRYPTYKIRIAPDSQKTQGLQAGDIIRRQYAERERTVYSLMCVTETGTELVGVKLLRKLNKELADQGYVTVSGKIPRAFWEKKFYGYSQIAM